MRRESSLLRFIQQLFRLGENLRTAEQFIPDNEPGDIRLQRLLCISCRIQEIFRETEEAACRELSGENLTHLLHGLPQIQKNCRNPQS